MNKGIALQALMKKQGAKAAFFIGDDVTDEDVFSLKDPRIFTVKVGGGKTDAQFFISDQKSVAHLLKTMIETILV
jgi:trehalose 6-phosphate phosphatase